MNRREMWARFLISIGAAITALVIFHVKCGRHGDGVRLEIGHEEDAGPTFDEALKAKWAREAELKQWASARCLRLHGVPVMGFGPTLVCVQAGSETSWLVSLESPLDYPGVVRDLDGVVRAIEVGPSGTTCTKDVPRLTPWAPLEVIPCPSSAP